MAHLLGDDPTTNYLQHNPRLVASSSLPLIQPRKVRPHQRQLPPVKPAPSDDQHGQPPAPPPHLPPSSLPPANLQFNPIQPALPLPSILNTMKAGGRTAQKKLLSDIITYAETEMRARGVPKSGYSEARLAVWREVYGSLFETLPSYRHVLLRVQQEYDEALRTLRDQLASADTQAAAAWADQQRLESAAYESSSMAEVEQWKPPRGQQPGGGRSGRGGGGGGGGALLHLLHDLVSRGHMHQRGPAQSRQSNPREHGKTQRRIKVP